MSSYQDERVLDVGALREVREAYEAGHSIADIADWHSVSESLILKVLIQMGLIEKGK